MGDWPSDVFRGDQFTYTISCFGENSLGGNINRASGAGTAWPSANRALFLPFRIGAPSTVYRLATGTGTGTTGNFDLGIYNQWGTRLVSTGSTAKTTASSERIVDVTDTVLGPGVYYLAMATDGVTAYSGITPTSLFLCKLAGMRQMDSAFVLPATATFATIGAAFVPYVAAFLRAE